MSPSTKAETHPGGAPIKSSSSKKPCKYGPRDEEGRCPKKPSSSTGRSSTKRTPKAKPPCKYGARTSDGKCPKKPKAPKKERTPSVRDYDSVGAAAKQAGQVLRSKKATSEQKHEAVKVLGAAVATESGKKVVEHAVTHARKALKTPAGRAAAVKAAKSAAKAAKVVGTATAIGTILAIGGAALDANRARECRAYAKRELAATKKRLAQKLTAEQEATLLSQYEEFCKKQPAKDPSYLGK